MYHFVCDWRMHYVAGIRGYPSVRAYFPKQDIDGEVYDGEHTPEAIEAWVSALRAPPATVKLGRSNFRARVLEPSAGLWVRRSLSTHILFHHAIELLLSLLTHAFTENSGRTLPESRFPRRW